MSKQDAQVGGENHYEWDMRRGTARETVSAWPDILQIICDGFESLPGIKEGSPGGRTVLELVFSGFNEGGRCRRKEAKNPRCRR